MMVAISILSALLAVLIPRYAYAEENRIDVILHGIQDHPVAGSPWTLTLLINHSDPGEVDVLVPHLAGDILLEQVVKGPRFRNPVSGQTFQGNPGADATAFERWTAIEYRFMLYNPGNVLFDPFTVITPRGQAVTDPFELPVQRPPSRSEVRYQLAWEGLPPGLRIGESAVIILRFRGPAAVLPQAAFFLPQVPQGHILESLPVSMEERSAGMTLRLRLVPLGASPFILERRQLTYNNTIFEIPALRIPVSRIPADQTADIHAGEAMENGPNLPFPALERAASGNLQLYRRYQTEYTMIYNTVRGLWERGDRALALASLRREERDHPAGALFAVIRREAEHSLGFYSTGDETRRNALSLRRRAQTAVTNETPIHHVPDSSGEITGLFREGQPVIIMARGETWLRVRANDSGGITGWVAASSIHIY